MTYVSFFFFASFFFFFSSLFLFSFIPNNSLPLTPKNSKKKFFFSSKKTLYPKNKTKSKEKTQSFQDIHNIHTYINIYLHYIYDTLHPVTPSLSNTTSKVNSSRALNCERKENRVRKRKKEQRKKEEKEMKKKDFLKKIKNLDFSMELNLLLQVGIHSNSVLAAPGLNHGLDLLKNK